MELLVSSPSSTIIIEEPETQIHPAMLAKLLNEIETYTYGQNLIISTHSPKSPSSDRYSMTLWISSLPNL